LERETCSSNVAKAGRSAVMRYSPGDNFNRYEPARSVAVAVAAAPSRAAIRDTPGRGVFPLETLPLTRHTADWAGT
jgi:hypothetical protein